MGQVPPDEEKLRQQHDEFYGDQPAPLPEVTAAVHGQAEAGWVPSDAEHPRTPNIDDAPAVAAVQRWLRRGALHDEYPSAEVITDLLGIAIAGCEGRDELVAQRDDARRAARWLWVGLQRNEGLSADELCRWGWIWVLEDEQP